MKSNTELLKIAQTHLGQGGARFRKFCGLPSGSAWCNAFVDYVANEGGCASLFFNGNKYTYCPTSMKWCQSHLAQIPIYLALPMDILFFDWDKNDIPNHIAFARGRKSDQEIYTIEGNTSGGIVAEKTRTENYVCGCYRPAFRGEFDTSKALVIDGYFGYNSIACLQKALKASGHYTDAIDGIMGRNTVKALQKRAGVTADASWGKGTSKAVQKMVGAEVDGYFGVKSTKKLQEWINKQLGMATPVVVPKSADINAKALDYAWKVGTKESVYKYPSGKPTPAFISAWKKYFPNDKINCGCHQYVNLVLKACGYKGFPSYKWSDILSYLRKNFTEIKVDFSQSQLKAGDIRVHKNSEGGYHIWIIVNDGGKKYRAEANQTGNKRYAHINTNTSGNAKKHRGDWLFRAK